MKALLVIVAGLLSPLAVRADDFVREEVTFENGPITLSGDLLKPVGQGPFPVFVWCHGSGGSNRTWARDYSHVFVKAGFAFLAWDKPGVGKSTGSSYPQSLTNRAKEIAAATEMLTKRGDINSNRISYCGVSQAGYILPRVVQMFPQTEKLILIGPGSWSFSEERAYQRQTTPLKKYASLVGLTNQQEQDEFLAMYRKVYDASDEEFIDQYMVFHREAGSKPWYRKTQMLVTAPPTDPKELADFKLLFQEGFAFDAVKEYAAIRCPTLILFGEKDECVDPAVGLANIRAGFKRSSNDRLSVIVYPKVGHALDGAVEKSKQDILDWLIRTGREQ